MHLTRFITIVKALKVVFKRFSVQNSSRKLKQLASTRFRIIQLLNRTNYDQYQTPTSNFPNRNEEKESN